MRSNQRDLLHAQALQHILHALGAAQVNFYSTRGGDLGEYSSGVIMLDKDRIALDRYLTDSAGGGEPVLRRYRTEVMITVTEEVMP